MVISKDNKRLMVAIIIMALLVILADYFIGRH